SHVDINGGAVLEEGVFVGSHGVVLPGAHVGAWARVGAGSVVLRNVPPDTTVFGVPSKPIGKKAP
ncbi:MAG: transferase, partial [Planctomycetota bacterium]